MSGDDGVLHDWGPQLVWTRPWVCHVPQADAEAEAMRGSEVVNSDERRVVLFEYAIIAKSLVKSTPVTRTGLILLPCRALRAKATQES